MANRIRGLVLVALVLGLILATAPTAMANSGPPRMSGDKAGVVLPGASSQMHVRHETLRFELNERLDGAKVTARYEMENAGPALTQYPVIFVTQERGNGSDLTATWNGQPLAVTPVETTSLAPEQAAEMARAWTASDTLIDPVTGERLPEREWFSEGRVQYYRFELDVPAGAKGTLEVQYDHAAYRESTMLVEPVFLYQYLLLPAKGWASFGPLEIYVKAPGPEAAYFASTLPMTYQDGEYRISLPGLPEENLTFSLMSKEHILFGWTTSTPYFVLAELIALIAAVALGFGIGWVAGLIRSRGLAIAVAIVVGLFGGGIVLFWVSIAAVSSFAALQGPGYGALLGAILSLVVLVPVTTTIAGVYAARRNARLAKRLASSVTHLG